MNIKQTILNCQNQILKENNIALEAELDMEMSTKNGIDSMGIVELVLGIEEELDIELDKALPSIRKCGTLRQLMEIVEQEYKVQHP